MNFLVPCHSLNPPSPSSSYSAAVYPSFDIRMDHDDTMYALAMKRHSALYRNKDRMQTQWRLHFDILAYLLDLIEDDPNTTIALMSTCQSLRQAGVRPLLTRNCRSIYPLASPRILSSFCAFMNIDFPSRCMHLRELNIHNHNCDLQAYNPESLREFGRIVVNSPNVKTLNIDSNNYIHLANTSAGFYHSFCSGNRTFVNTLHVVFDSRTAALMSRRLLEMRLPALANVDFVGLTLEQSMVLSFQDTIQKLSITSLQPFLLHSSWWPFPRVKHLVLTHIPWWKLNLQFLVVVFPNLKILEMYEDEEMDEFGYSPLTPSLQVNGWPILHKLAGDLNYVSALYTLGLRSPIHELVICSPFCFPDVRRFSDIMGRIRVGKLNISVSLYSSELDDFLQIMKKCVFSRVVRLYATFVLVPDLKVGTKMNDPITLTSFNAKLHMLFLSTDSPWE
ncbi:hypothetical protein K474DRAFT_617920 [Panus rudis PR-1116 ss-1]|nr:hypothetical protein K474DRAFT_617920 [Panus rudis PR-1116 ss-1]